MLCKRSKEEIIAIKTTYKKRTNCKSHYLVSICIFQSKSIQDLNICISGFFKSLEEGIETLLESDAAKWIKLLVTWEESDCCCDLQQASRDTQVTCTYLMFSL